MNSKRKVIASIAFPFLIAIMLLVGTARYNYLKTRFQITQFFKNASVCLSAFFYDEQQNLGLSFLPEGWKLQTANLLNYVTDEYRIIEPKHRLDPFLEDGKLEVRYGMVRHPVEVKLESSIYDPDRPVFFTWSAGPSSKVNHIKIKRDRQEEMYEYTFQTMPYDISNGIWSVGYLYSDSQGVQIGEVN